MARPGDLALMPEVPRIQPAQPVRSNLALQLTTFVGRDAVLADLRSLLPNSRIVTLTGAGGSGKTRLAAELARGCVNDNPGGVWWVDLAPVADPHRMSDAVVAALDLPGRESAVDVVTAWLAARRAVLVLDNCEHLLDACADFCALALRHCPELTIIATSREPLSVPGEVRWPVMSMLVGEAVELFEARAQLVDPKFNVTSSNRETVTEICERLDWMPLAIELAAARIEILTEREILVELSDRFRLLVRRDRDAPERQQTMFATIDWSYRLLTKEEKELFRRLAVFRGGFSLESVRAVCSMAGVLELVSGLVHKSMIVAERAVDSSTRYRLLESQLDYAGDRLQEAGELDLLQRRHYEYFRHGLDAGTRREATGKRHPGLAESRWIAAETANLWAAMEWARSNADDSGLSFAADVSRVLLGDVAHGRKLLEDVLEHSSQTGVARVYALQSAAWLAVLQRDGIAAVRAADASLDLARDLGDPEVLASTLFMAANAYVTNGQLDAAIELYKEAGNALRESGSRSMQTTIRACIAQIAVQQGAPAAGRDILADCVETARSEGDAWAAAAYLNMLGWAQIGLNDHVAAAAGFGEALQNSGSFRDYLGILASLHGLICVAGARSDHQRVIRLAAAAKRLSDEWTIRDEAWSETNVEEVVRRSRARLGTQISREAWEQGWAMTVDQVIDYALGESEPATRIEAGPLTARQREVAALVAAGLTNREIAERLVIAERSAEGHVERIRNKLGVRSRTEVATWAVDHGLRSQLPTDR